MYLKTNGIVKVIETSYSQDIIINEILPNPKLIKAIKINPIVKIILSSFL